MLHPVALILIILTCTTNATNIYNDTIFLPYLTKHFNTSQCLSDILEVLKAAINQELWAMKMLDSSSKIQSEFADGNIVNLGAFDECVSIENNMNQNHRIKGKYCLYSWIFQNIPIQNWNLIPGQEAKENITNKYLKKFGGVPIIESLCIPNTCSAQELQKLYEDNKFTQIDRFLTAKFDEKYCQPVQVPFDYIAWLGIFMFGGVFALIKICTAYELYLIYKQKKPLHKILLSFSLCSNIKNLTTVRRTNEQIPCINGIRTISMFWIILGHRYLISAAGPNTNYLQILSEWLVNDSTNLIIGAVFAVDTFFIISGILVIYVVLLAKSSGFNFNIIYYYLHRVFRLSPALVMVILFYVSFFRYIGSGPLWPILIHMTETRCRATWWRSLLFLQNLQESFDVCVPQTWYLACDTQLYIVAPLIFLTILKWPAPIISTIIVLICGSCYGGFITAWNDQDSASIISVGSHYKSLYAATHIRMHAWLIGTILGYILFKYRGQKLKIHHLIVKLLWITSLSAMLYIVYTNTYFIKYPYNRLLSSLYFGFARAVWSVCMCWIIFACRNGYGGLINKFLSTRCFIVLGRLTYSMYLIHMGYITWLSGQKREATTFSNFHTIIEFLGDIVGITIISAIWSLAFESPIINIGKILLPQAMSRKLKEINKQGEETYENTTTISTHL